MLSGLSIVSAGNVDVNDTLAADDQGIDLNATGTVGLDKAVTTTSAGTVTITNGGLLTIAAVADMTLAGAFLQDGAGAVSTGGDITTSNDAVTFSAGVTLTGDVAIGSTGSKVWFKDTLGGNYLLTITAGAGDVQFDKAVGMLSGLSIVSAGNVDVNDTLAADDQGIDLNATGTVGLDKAVTTTSAGTVTITNGGLLTIAAVADMTLAGALLQDGAGAVSTAGDITTSNDAVTFSAGVTLTGDVAIGSTGSKVWFKDTLGGNYLLTITAGAGDVQFDKAVGMLSGLSIVSAGNVDVNDTLAADDQGIDLNATGTVGLDKAVTTTSAGTVTITNGGLLTIAAVADMTLAGAFLQDGAGAVSTGGDITTSNDAVTFSAGVTLTGDVAIGSTGGKVWFKDTLGGNYLLTITAGAGDVQFDKAVGMLSGLSIVSAGNVDVNDTLAADDQGIDLNATGTVGLDKAVTTTSAGTVTITNGGLLTIAAAADMTLAGAFLQDGAGAVSTGGDITTSNDAVTFSAGVTLTGDVAIGSTGGKVWFKDTLGGNYLLTITAGAGDVQFDKAVGMLSGLSIVSAGNVDVNDTLAADDQGIDLNATGTVGLDKAVTTTSAGTVTITNGGLLTIAAAADMTLAGAFLQDGAGAVSTGGDITTSNDAVTFSAGVTLTGDVAIGSTGGKVWFKDTLGGNYLLTITAGAGDVQFDEAVGMLSGLSIVSAGNVDVNDTLAADDQGIDLNATGTVGLDKAVTTTSAGTVTITNGGLLTIAAAADMTLAGAFLQDGAGAVSTGGDITTSNDAVTFSAGVTLTGDVAIGSTGSKVWFKDTLGGNYVLTITAGAGDVQFDKAVGMLSGLSIVSAGNVDVNDTLAADDQGIDLNATGTVGLDKAVTTTSAGTVTITNGGLLTIAAVADMTLAGALLQDGAGAVSTAGDITTSNDAVTFSAGVTLTGDVAIGSTGSKVWFKDTLGGNYLLTITAGAGDVQFDKAVGMLSGLSIVSAGNVDVNDTLAADDQGIDLNATGMVGLDKAVTTTSAGTVTITNGGLLTIAAVADMTLAGAFLQDGAGAVSTGGDITTSNDAVTFSAGVTLTGDVAIGSTGSKVWFKDTLGGNYLLTITAGAGDVQFDKAVGMLSGLSIVSAGNVDVNDTLAADDQGIDLNATGTVGLDKAVTTTSAGTVTITNGGLLTIAAVADMTLAGAFLQDGAGAVSTAGDISTTADDITFTAGVTLTDAHAVTLSTGAGVNGSILFGSTLDGTTGFAEDLTLTAGLGNVTFTGAVGATMDLGDVRINSAVDVWFKAATNADSLVQVAGTGDTRFDGAVTINSSASLGLAITTNAVTVNNTITTLNGGMVSMTVQNAVNFNAGSGVSAAGTISILANQDHSGTEGFTQASGTTIQTADTGTSAFSLTVNTGAGGTAAANIAAIQTGVGGRVTIQANGGPIVDNNTDSTNVTAAQAALSATGGIGSGDALETTITDLAYNNASSGSVEIANIGSLVVNSVGALTTSSNAGATSLSATSPITFAVNDTQASITAQAIESGAANDSITVNANVTVTASTGNVLFQAGDSIVLTDGTSKVQATASGAQMTFESGYNDTDSSGSMQLDGIISGNTSNGVLTLDLHGQLGATQASGGSIAVYDLLLKSTGTSGSFALATSSANDVSRIAGSTNGAINFRDDNGVTVGNGSIGITTIDDNVTIDSSNGAGGTIVISKAITTEGTLTGGTVSVSGAVTLNAPLTTAGGSITLKGQLTGSGDIVIGAGANITSSATIDLSAPRDILVGALLQTSDPGADIILTADSPSPNGVGGVRIEVAGQLVSAHAVTLTGSDLSVTAATLDSVLIDVDGTNNQIQAVGDVLLQDSGFAPAGADIVINGRLQTTGTGDITVNALDRIELSANLTAADKIDLEDAVLLTAGVTLSAGGNGIDFDATLNGAFNLVLNASGPTTLTGAVGNSAPVGSGTGAAITINSTGNTRFYSTVQTASGISATDTAATVQFDDNVTIGAGNTGSTFNGNVTLNGLTFTSNGGLDVTFGDAATDQVLSAGGDVTIDINSGGGGAAGLTVRGLVDGGQDLILSVDGLSDFQRAVGGTTPIGDGTGAAITINSTGATEFDGTVGTQSGIVQGDGVGTVTFRDNVTIDVAGGATGNTGSTFNSNVVLDGLTLTSNNGLPVVFGNAATDTVVLSTDDVTINIHSGSAGDESLTVVSIVNGGQDLILGVDGLSDFQSAVGGASPIGDGTGAAITINSTGATAFDNTVGTQSGIVQSVGAAAVTFRQDVTIDVAGGPAGNTGSTFNENLILDGLVFTSNNGLPVAIGTVDTDTVTLSGDDVTIAINAGGAGAATLTVLSVVNGGQDLTLAVAGLSDFQSAVGNLNPIGDGDGLALTINSLGDTEFDATLATTSGISQAGTAGLVTFRDNVTIGAGTIGSTFDGSVTLDGLTLNAGRGVTFGSDSADQVTLASSAVDIHTTANGGNLTFNAKIDGAQDLTLSTNTTGNVAFNGLIGSVPPPLLSLTVTVANQVDFNATTTVSGDVEIHATNNVTVAAGVTILADSNLDGTGTVTIQADSNTNGAGDVSANATSTIRGNVVSISGANVTVGIVSANTNPASTTVGITATNGNANLNGTVTATTNVTVDANSLGGSASVLQAASTDILAGGNVTIDGKTAVTLNGTVGTGASIGGDVRINTNLTGAVNLNGDITANGAVTIGTLAGGNVRIAAAGTPVITADNNNGGEEDLTIQADGYIWQSAGKLQSKSGAVFVYSDNNYVTVVDVDSAGANQLNPKLATNNTAGPFAAVIQIHAASTVTVAGVNATGSPAIVEVVSDNADIQLGDISARTSVFLQASNTSSGAIVDANNGATNVMAANLAAVAGIGIGSGGSLETKVSTLAASNSTSGNILVDNTVGGPLTIGTVGNLKGVTNSDADDGAPFGTVVITNVGALTVEENVSSAGSATLQATDTSATNTEVLTINANRSVTAGNVANTATVTLNGGDAVNIPTTSAVIADTTITINVDNAATFVTPPGTDPDLSSAGQVAVAPATLTAPSGTTINGGDDLNPGGVTDAFLIAPQAGSSIVVNGNQPVLPTNPGDTLTMDFSALTSADRPPTLTVGLPGAGGFSFPAGSTLQGVTYASIETVLTSTSEPYHLILDSRIPGSYGNNGVADLINVHMDLVSSVNNLVLERTGIGSAAPKDFVGEIFRGDSSKILSLTIEGSSDDDTVTFDETATAGKTGGPLAFASSLYAAPTSHVSSTFTALTGYSNPDPTQIPTPTSDQYLKIQFTGSGGTNTVNTVLKQVYGVVYTPDAGSAHSGNIGMGNTSIPFATRSWGVSFVDVSPLTVQGVGGASTLMVDASSAPLGDIKAMTIQDAGGVNTQLTASSDTSVPTPTASATFAPTTFTGFINLAVRGGTGSQTLTVAGVNGNMVGGTIILDGDNINRMAVGAYDPISNPNGYDPYADTLWVQSTSNLGGTPVNVAVRLLGGHGSDNFWIYQPNAIDDQSDDSVVGIGGPVTVSPASGAATPSWAAWATDFTPTGADSLLVRDTADTTGHPALNVTTTQIAGIAPRDITYSQLNTLTVVGGRGVDKFDIPQFLNATGEVNVDLRTATFEGYLGNDTFTVIRSKATLVSINGGSPGYGDSGLDTGDTLNWPAFGPPYMINGTTIRTVGWQDVNYADIENLPLAPLPSGTPALPLLYDLNGSSSSQTQTTPVAYVGVLPTAVYDPSNTYPDPSHIYQHLTYGWTVPMDSNGYFQEGGLDRDPLSGPYSNLFRDGHMSVYPHTYRATVPSAGWYLVSVSMGDAGTGRDHMRVTSGNTGQVLLDDISTAAGEIRTEWFVTYVPDAAISGAPTLLDLVFSDQGGDPFWVANAITIDSAKAFGAGGRLNSFGTSNPSFLTADGVTQDTYQGVNASDSAEVTVSTTLGTIVTADVDPNVPGVQVLATGTTFRYVIQRPTGGGTGTITFQDLMSLQTGSIDVSYVVPPTRRFDFNSSTSPTQTPAATVRGADAVTAVDAVLGTFTVTSALSGLAAGDRIHISSSTGNDGTYTVTNVNGLVLTVSEPIPVAAPTAKGVVDAPNGYLGVLPTDVYTSARGYGWDAALVSNGYWQQGGRGSGVAERRFARVAVAAGLPGQPVPAYVLRGPAQRDLLGESDDRRRHDPARQDPGRGGSRLGLWGDPPSQRAGGPVGPDGFPGGHHGWAAGPAVQRPGWRPPVGRQRAGDPASVGYGRDGDHVHQQRRDHVAAGWSSAHGYRHGEYRLRRVEGCVADAQFQLGDDYLGRQSSGRQRSVQRLSSAYGPGQRCLQF